MFKTAVILCKIKCLVGECVIDFIPLCNEENEPVN